MPKDRSGLFSIHHPESLAAMNAQDNTDTILWRLTSLRFVFDTTKSSTQLDHPAKDPRTPYSSPLYYTHRHVYNVVQFYPYGLDLAAGTHASIMFALFSCDYDDFWSGRFLK